MDHPRDLLFDRVADAPTMAGEIRRVLAGEKVSFGHVAASAQPFLCALLARRIQRTGVRAWIICASERAQEKFHAELTAWLPEALIFPHLEVAAVEGAVPDPETTAERLAVIQQLAAGRPATVVLNPQSLNELVPTEASVQGNSLRIARGTQCDRGRLIAQLVKAGYEAVSQVIDRGQFAVRGGVMDIYSWQQVLPVRMEWFDDVIESTREFELDQQTSIRALDGFDLLLEPPKPSKSTLSKYRNNDDFVVSVEHNSTIASVTLTGGYEQVAEGSTENFDTAFFASPLEYDPSAPHSPAIHAAAHRRVEQQLKLWADEQYLLTIQIRKKSEQSGVESLLEVFTQKHQKPVFLSSASGGTFVCPGAKLAITSGAELLGYATGLQNRSGGEGRSRRGLLRQRSQIDFTEFTEGDLVVHLEHGIAKFAGLQSRVVANDDNSEKRDHSDDFMLLEFADHAKLYVPLDQAFLVSRYVGLGKRGAALSELGDGKWTGTKKTAEKAIYDYAAKLLKVQAARETHSGFIYPADNQWQEDFEDAFPYRETADQVKAIRETKEDMESGRPMDRLICGDVGFGKTEVAIRAAFKAAVSGKQVAMMVPTTVLAQQHYENFSARMANFPVTVELLSRYRSRADQHRVAEGIRDGSVDIVIGTHRLISKDIAFKDLGLLIVDEEQRFGVRHKERIKEKFPHVDVLTLSATPIPRTLYMALTGARDLSTLETAPPNRYPVETNICAYDERIIRAAIDRELDRQGQVYFLHNRVEDIERVAAKIRHICPRARVDIGHGQMEEGQLEEIMHRFVNGETDVLIATTIIESGLDIPNANTIFIDRADRFGLADLYQLRGRVGRSQHKAYAYLLLPRDLLTVGEARKRINAIKQYSTLGAGFKIALRDLEIRGAGNILGLAQSGHLTAVGFDLYCQLLRQAVGKLKGEKVRHRIEVAMHLDFMAANEAEYLAHLRDDGRAAPDAHAPWEKKPKAARPVRRSERGSFWPAYVPAEYITESKLRIQAYRQIAEITRQEELDKLGETWRDRFGRLPEPATNLLELTQLKLLAASHRVQQIEVRGDKVMFTRGGDYVLVGGKFPRLTSTTGVSKVREIHRLLAGM